MDNFRSVLKRWNKQTSSFARLQQVYLVISVSTLLIAGVVGLVNYRLGQSLLFLSLFTLVVFVSNGVVWALISTFLASTDSKPTTTSKNKR